MQKGTYGTDPEKERKSWLSNRLVTSVPALANPLFFLFVALQWLYDVNKTPPVSRCHAHLFGPLNKSMAQ
jgi:hypothetical protein